MQLTCLVLEDSATAFELIKKYIGRIPFMRLVQSAYDPVEGTHLLNTHQADVLFVDITVPAYTELLSKLTDTPLTICTSAFKKMAWKGFDYGALDFLQKPIDFERFTRAAERAINLFRLKQTSLQLSTEHILVRSGYSTIKVLLGDIEYIEGFVDYIRIHLLRDKPIVAMMTLKTATEILPIDRFRRIHRSYIVAVPQIRALKHNKATLFSGKELPISRKTDLKI